MPHWLFIPFHKNYKRWENRFTSGNVVYLRKVRNNQVNLLKLEEGENLRNFITHANELRPSRELDTLHTKMCPQTSKPASIASKLLKKWSIDIIAVLSRDGSFTPLVALVSGEK